MFNWIVRYSLHNRLFVLALAAGLIVYGALTAGLGFAATSREVIDGLVALGFGASLNKPIVRKNGEWILPVSLWERWHIDKPFADCYHELDAVRGANVFVSADEGGHWRYRGGLIFRDSCFNEHTVAGPRYGPVIQQTIDTEEFS